MLLRATIEICHFLYCIHHLSVVLVRNYSFWKRHLPHSPDLNFQQAQPRSTGLFISIRSWHALQTGGTQLFSPEFHSNNANTCTEIPLKISGQSDSPKTEGLEAAENSRRSGSVSKRAEIGCCITCDAHPSPTQSAARESRLRIGPFTVSYSVMH
jgi:hypothetical protein